MSEKQLVDGFSQALYDAGERIAALEVEYSNMANDYAAYTTQSQARFAELTTEVERLRDLLNQAHAELTNALDDAAGLRTLLHDTLNDLQAERWGKHAPLPRTVGIPQEAGDDLQTD